MMKISGMWKEILKRVKCLEIIVDEIDVFRDTSSAGKEVWTQTGIYEYCND